MRNGQTSAQFLYLFGAIVIFSLARCFAKQSKFLNRVVNVTIFKKSFDKIKKFVFVCRIHFVYSQHKNQLVYVIFQDSRRINMLFGK